MIRRNRDRDETSGAEQAVEQYRVAFKTLNDRMQQAYLTLLDDFVLFEKHTQYVEEADEGIEFLATSIRAQRQQAETRYLLVSGLAAKYIDDQALPNLETVIYESQAAEKSVAVLETCRDKMSALVDEYIFAILTDGEE